jgi:threonine dehydrogenase-like Zn-dependent dehydrogenase
MTARLAVSKRGASVCVVVDTNPARLRWASNWGATSVLNPKSDDVLDAVKGLTQGDGADAAIDAVGYAQTRAQAIAAIRRGGRAVFLGLHENPTSIPGNEIVRFEKQIIGSFSYSDIDFGRAAVLASTGFVETESGWLDVRGLESGQESFAEQAQATAPYSKIILRSKTRR